MTNYASSALLGTFLLAFSASAAAFDCAAARNDAEHTICGDPDLSKLEEALSAQYQISLRDTNSPEALRRDELGWLSRRNACRKDARCLSLQYRQRLLELSSEDRGSTNDDMKRSLPVLPCAHEASLASIESHTPTEVTFLNDSDERVTVYWLGFDGNRVKYMDLAAGGSYRQQTYLSHPWVVAGANDRCLGLYLPRATRGVAVVGSPATR